MTTEVVIHKVKIDKNHLQTTETRITNTLAVIYKTETNPEMLEIVSSLVLGLSLYINKVSSISQGSIIIRVGHKIDKLVIYKKMITFKII